MILPSLLGCAANPATGKMQLNVVDEQTELRMGAEMDAQIAASMPMVEDEGLQAWVSGVVQRLAATSERPDLPWTVRVLDDEALNAFAVPGGHLYVTRGLLCWLHSEDELAAVLGHEVAHVTARHSATAMSRAVLGSPFGALVHAVDPNQRHVGAVVGVGAGLFGLKHSRADEREADELSLRYLERAGYDPAAMLDVLAVLEATEDAAGRLPTWLSTHPPPEDRLERLGAVASTGERDTASLVAHLDGLVFGADPRRGTLIGDRFVVPEAALGIDLPAGWKHEQRDGQLVSVAPDGMASLQVGDVQDQDPEQALAALMEGLQPGEAREDGLRGFRLEGMGRDGAMHALDGLATAVVAGDRVWMAVGAGDEGSWDDVRSALEVSLTSLGPEEDPAVLGVRPQRLRMVELPGPTALATFAEEHPGAPATTLALLNRADEQLPAGVVRFVE
ncbi:MAG: M48 family metalloprotease [Myxococcales bacterium]|nr:M48 family metalloprotease [Myxococcales bacterium]